MIREKDLIAKSSSNGFTLMETAIAIAVASLMLTGAAALFKTWMNESTIVTNQQRMIAIQQALTTYEEKFNKLPCPASYTALPGSAGYGRGTVDPCTAAPAGGALKPGRFGTIDPLGKGAKTTGEILIGALPTRDLGLPESYIADTYGYRYTYAVTQSETTTITTPAPPFAPNPPGYNPYGGAIEVKDGGGNDITPVAPDKSIGTAPYILVDHGPDGAGAYTISGVLHSACPGAGTTQDSYNCNNYTTGYFVNAPFSQQKVAGVPGPKWFDDTVIFDTSGSAKVCVTTFANSTTAGSSEGYDLYGIDGSPLPGWGAGLDLWVVFVETFVYWFDNTFALSPSAPLLLGDTYNAISPTADAYCPDASFHVVAGGCSDTFGGPTDAAGIALILNADGTPVTLPVNGPLSDVFGGDISTSNGALAIENIDWNVLPSIFPWFEIPNWPTYYYQTVRAPLSHPIQNAAGIQGWECNGSSAYGIQTQAYAVCCNR
jgi:prepilin-type N-terminal cleavage/methylation domain-containing protein